MADICKLVELGFIAKSRGHLLRMPADFPNTLRRALFRAATLACVDALDHDDERWARFQPGFGMCAPYSQAPEQSTVTMYQRSQCIRRDVTNEWHHTISTVSHYGLTYTWRPRLLTVRKPRSFNEHVLWH